MSQLRRQVKSADSGILIEVAQNVRQLQSASEVVSERKPVLLLHSEDAYGKSPDRTCHLVAIFLQRRLVRRADVAHHIHFHPINDGMEVLPLQSEIAQRPHQTCGARGRISGIELVNIGTPAVELLAAHNAWFARISDIVDLAAKGIDFEHGLALRTR